jgi:rubrerythrin
MLRREFGEILVHEERARAFYDHYIEQVEDDRIKAELSRIRDDEIVHIRIARELLDIVS